MAFQQASGDSLVCSQLLLQNEQRSFNSEDKLFFLKGVHSIRGQRGQQEKCELYAAFALLPLIDNK